jgi:hypothetical protein
MRQPPAVGPTELVGAHGWGTRDPAMGFVDSQV